MRRSAVSGEVSHPHAALRLSAFLNTVIIDNKYRAFIIKIV